MTTHAKRRSEFRTIHERLDHYSYGERFGIAPASLRDLARKAHDRVVVTLDLDPFTGYDAPCPPASDHLAMYTFPGVNRRKVLARCRVHWRSGLVRVKEIPRGIVLISQPYELLTSKFLETTRAWCDKQSMDFCVYPIGWHAPLLAPAIIYWTDDLKLDPIPTKLGVGSFVVETCLGTPVPPLPPLSKGSHDGK
jgi:hypothetical protein